MSEFYFLPPSCAFVILVTPSSVESFRLPFRKFGPSFSDVYVCWERYEVMIKIQKYHDNDEKLKIW